MRQNIDKQQNISPGIYNSFRDNAHIFIRTKALDPPICRIWRTPKCHTRPRAGTFRSQERAKRGSAPRGSAECPWVQAPGYGLSTSPPPRSLTRRRAAFSEGASCRLPAERNLVPWGFSPPGISSELGPRCSGGAVQPHHSRRGAGGGLDGGSQTPRGRVSLGWGGGAGRPSP